MTTEIVQNDENGNWNLIDPTDGSSIATLFNSKYGWAIACKIPQVDDAVFINQIKNEKAGKKLLKELQEGKIPDQAYFNISASGNRTKQVKTEDSSEYRATCFFNEKKQEWQVILYQKTADGTELRPEFLACTSEEDAVNKLKETVVVLYQNRPERKAQGTGGARAALPGKKKEAPVEKVTIETGGFDDDIESLIFD